VGASVSQRPPIDDVERFLSMLSFDSKGKLMDLGFSKDILSSLKRN